MIHNYRTRGHRPKMRTTRAILIGVILTALMVPLAYSIFFIGPTMFIATNGGITTFAENFTATSLTYPDGLNRFTHIVWGGNFRGNFGVDADTGVNVTVTQIGRDQVTYTVTTAAPGAVHSYIYYYRNVATAKLRAPTEVTADGVVAPFTYAGGIANIMTTGSPVVVVASYMGGGGVTASLFDTVTVAIGLITLIVLVMIMHAVGKGDMTLSTAWRTILLVLIIAAVAMLTRSWGY